MLIQILTHTPTWVFVLFFVLVALGISQMRRRTLPLRRVIIMPIVFLVWSFFGVTSAFGWEALPLLAWATGYVLTAWLLMQSKPELGSTFDAATGRFNVAGSTVPLALMMGIFFLKYFVGVSMGMRFDFTTSEFFPIVIGALYGAFSGTFAGSAARLIRLTQ